MTKLVLFVGFLSLLGGGAWYATRESSAKTTGQNLRSKPAPVIVVNTMRVRERDIPVYLDGIGTVQAYFTVAVQSQVDGQLLRVHFQEGQEVKKGDLLAEIDPRIYKAQEDQAVARKKQNEAKELQDIAKLKQDKAKKLQNQALEKQMLAKKAQNLATLENARLNLKRLLGALSSLSEQTLNDQKTLVAQLEATIQSDEAAIQSARAAIQADEALIQADEAILQADKALLEADEAALKYAQTFLSYTSIKAPCDGRVGIRLIDPGNIVRASQTTAIVVVTQMEPMAVVFTLPQQELLRIQARLQEEKNLTVIALDASNTNELDRGRLLLIDNQIDPSTGTIKLKALFPNQHRRLWPGGFVNVRLHLTTLQKACLVTAGTVQQGPEGSLVFVVKEDQTVEARRVEVALIQDGEAVILKGLSPGEEVVLSGQDRLKIGTKVTVHGSKEVQEKRNE